MRIFYEISMSKTGDRMLEGGNYLIHTSILSSNNKLSFSLFGPSFLKKGETSTVKFENEIY